MAEKYYEGEEIKKRGGVAGIILGIISIAVSFLLSLMGGIIAGIPALVLGVVALIIGIRGIKSGSGKAAVVIGILAVAITVITQVTAAGTGKTIQNAAKEENLPLMEKYCSNPYLGLAGIFLNASNDQANMDQFTEELNRAMEDK